MTSSLERFVLGLDNRRRLRELQYTMLFHLDKAYFSDNRWTISVCWRLQRLNVITNGAVPDWFCQRSSIRSLTWYVSPLLGHLTKVLAAVWKIEIQGDHDIHPASRHSASLRYNVRTVTVWMRLWFIVITLARS